MNVMTTLLKLDKCDGIVYGNTCKRLTAMRAVRYGWLFWWKRGASEDAYHSREVKPYNGINLADIIGADWHNCAFLLDYAFSVYQDPELQEYKIPDLSDINSLSGIPWMDEPMDESQRAVAVGDGRS